MSNDFENQNNGVDNGVGNEQNSYQQNYTNPYQQNYTNPYQQDYSNSQNNQQNTAGQYNSYDGQYGNYNGQYTSYNSSSAPLDKNGQPMKNNFGMKLTFSILEIISCNLISLILGIISCVFTCKANTAYKEGRWEEFKSSAKTSAITLWIGLVGVIIEIIALIVALVLGVTAASTVSKIDVDDDYGYYDDYDYYDDDDDDDFKKDDTETDTKEDTEADTETETTVEPSVVAEGTGFTDPTMTFNGYTVTFPVTFAEFSEATGYVMDPDDVDYVLNPEDYEITSLFDANGYELCDIWIMNLSDTAATMPECHLVGIIAYNDSYYTEAPDVVIQNDITFASTKEQVMAAFGTPSSTNSNTYDGSTYEVWSWDYADPAASYFDELEIDFVDGEIYCIEVDNTTE